MGSAQGARQLELLERLRAAQRSSSSSRGRASSLDPGHLARMVALAESTGDALAREHFYPGHFTASAFVTNADGTHLLLILHKKLQMWLQPGGHVEGSDVDLVAAAERELREETGLSDFVLIDALFDVDVHEIPAWGSAPCHFHHDVRVRFRALDDSLLASTEVAGVRWFPLREVAENRGVLAAGFGTDDSVRRVALRLLGRGPSGTLPA